MLDRPGVVALGTRSNDAGCGTLRVRLSRIDVCMPMKTILLERVNRGRLALESCQIPCFNARPASIAMTMTPSESHFGPISLSQPQKPCQPNISPPNPFPTQVQLPKH
jgi:hypothetical protein